MMSISGAVRTARIGGGRILLATVGLAALCAHAVAQDAARRGEVPQADLRRQTDGSAALLSPALSLPPYRPASAGAVPDEPADGDSLFPFEVDADQTTAPAMPQRAATTRRGRSDARAARTEAPDAAVPAEPAIVPAQGRTQRIDALDEELNRRVEPGNARLDAIETGTVAREQNPYAPLGLRLGTFDATVTLDQGILWSSNIDKKNAGGEAFVSQSELRLRAVSDWSSHSAQVEAVGIFQKSVSGGDYERTELGIDGSLAYDLGRETTVTATASYRMAPEAASSPIVLPATDSKPLNHEMSASLGVERSFGRARLGLTGAVEREIYSDFEGLCCGTVSQEDRNFTLSTIALRGGYEVSPAFTPFIEAEIGRRSYDLQQDTSGYRRSADRFALTGGTEIDLGEKVQGEVSVGWLRESFDDDRLVPVSALLLDGTLSWSPMRGTTVRVTGGTSVEGSTTAADSGSVLYTSRVELLRESRPNLTLGLLGGISFRDYVNSSDTETTLSAEVNATWWMNRFAGVNGRIRHERLDSTRPNRDYDESSIYLGLKLQR
ncbi:outer membrane beta-barrel protein [Aquibium microcysteis]|uniref:outer membrane beta-barrel protein n=1 Tax=Aquibium microcysteis TaxID=675281 RepID=UPI00165CF775|nr:outer membrane beta-barrel protein [Aquibium microcysteis]